MMAPDDLPFRLDFAAAQLGVHHVGSQALMREAAGEIRRLEAELARLSAPFRGYHREGREGDASKSPPDIG